MKDAYISLTGIKQNRVTVSVDICYMVFGTKGIETILSSHCRLQRPKTECPKVIFPKAGGIAASGPNVWLEECAVSAAEYRL